MLEYLMSVKLLTEHHLEFLSLKKGCTGSSESTLVKMPHYWKSRHSSFIDCHIKHKYFHFQPSLNETEDEGYAEKSDSDPPTPPPENTSVLGELIVTHLPHHQKIHQF